GKIKVLSGYGQINVNNSTRYGVQVNKLDASQQGGGKLVIIDKAKMVSGNPTSTIYTPNGAGGTLVAQGSHTYDPSSTMRYGWAISWGTRTVEKIHRESSNWLGLINLGSFDETGKTVENVGAPTLEGGAGFYYDVTAGGPNGDYNFNQTTVQTNAGAPEAQWKETYHEVRSSWYGKKTYITDYKKEVNTKSVAQHDISAHRQIGIEFFGGTEANVNVTSTSTGDVVIGNILNTSGTTTITSGGAIRMLADGAIGGRRVVLSAAAGIGTSQRAVTTNVTDTATSSLSAVATNGNVNIVERSGNLTIDNVRATGGGDVSIVVPQNLLVATGNDGLTIPHVQGSVISLNTSATSTNLGGGVGNSTAAPIVVESGDQLNHTVTVNANGNVFLKEKTGDLHLKQIKATGTVWVNVAAGGLVDANNSQTVDERIRSQLEAGLWADLGLTAATGANQKVADAIAGFKTTKETEYRTYWKYRNTQTDPSTYQSNFVVQLPAADETYYRDVLGYDNAGITTLVNKLTQEYHELHTRYGSYGNTFNAAFSYTLTAAEDTALRGSIKIWTAEELLFSMSGGVLKATADTVSVLEDPNIDGTDVTIITNRGIGNTTGKVVIDIAHVKAINPGPGPGTGKPYGLSSDERIAFSAADRPDITYIVGNIVGSSASPVTFNFTQGTSDTITRLDGGSFITDGFSVGRKVYVEGVSLNATAKGVFYEVASVTAGTITLTSDVRLAATETSMVAVLSPVIADPTGQFASVLKIGIDQRDDVNADVSGNLNVSAGANIYLGTLGGFNIQAITAVDAVRIKAKNDIVNAASSGANIASGDLILESGQGGIGTSAKNFSVLLSPSATLTARALSDVYISSSGTLNIAGVQSQNAGIHLTATGSSSILDGLNSDAPKFAGNVIELTAGGDIGAATNWLESDHTISGTLHATAAVSIWLREVDGNMNVDRITSTGGDVNLRAHLSVVDASTATGESTAKPGVDVFANNNINLTADVGAIGISGNDIDIDSARGGAGNLSITSFLGANIIEVAGDLSIDRITAGSAYTAFIAAPDGRIINGRTSGSNVLSGKAYLFAK
ncbi:MAG: hypothetical protein AAB092_05470, partial [Chloroflexota bacterium]